MVREFLLFIDTEASTLPIKWDRPYSTKGNWPCIVQLSWIIFKSDGSEVKHENYFIKDEDITISSSATKVHGITREMIDEKGYARKYVLSLLSNDIQQYQPLVVGHFIELDFHVVGADAYRAGIPNPLANSPLFCTMLATAHLVQNPAKKFLKLGDLYSFLFNTSLASQHNALEDARATAMCFFEILKRRQLDDEKIEMQIKFLKEPTNNNSKGCSIILLAIFLLFIIAITFLWTNG